MIFSLKNIALSVQEIGPVRYQMLKNKIDGFEDGILLIAPFVMTNDYCYEGFRLPLIEVRGEEAKRYVEDNFEMFLEELNEAHQAGDFNKWLSQALPEEICEAASWRNDMNHKYKWEQLSPDLKWFSRRFDWNSIRQRNAARAMRMRAL